MTRTDPDGIRESNMKLRRGFNNQILSQKFESNQIKNLEIKLSKNTENKTQATPPPLPQTQDSENVGNETTFFAYTVTTKNDVEVSNSVVYPVLNAEMLTGNKKLLSEVFSVIEGAIKSKAREIDRTGNNPLDFAINSENGNVVISENDLHKVFISTDEILIAQYKKALMVAYKAETDEAKSDLMLDESLRFNSLTKTKQIKIVCG